MSRFLTDEGRHRRQRFFARFYLEVRYTVRVPVGGQPRVLRVGILDWRSHLRLVAARSGGQITLAQQCTQTRRLRSLEVALNDRRATALTAAPGQRFTSLGIMSPGHKSGQHRPFGGSELGRRSRIPTLASPRARACAASGAPRHYHLMGEPPLPSYLSGTDRARTNPLASITGRIFIPWAW